MVIYISSDILEHLFNVFHNLHRLVLIQMKVKESLKILCNLTIALLNDIFLKFISIHSYVQSIWPSG